jgi:hypothetical protein
MQGDVGKHRLPNYSRGIRQSIYKMAKEGGWAEKHKVLVSGSALAVFCSLLLSAYPSVAAEKRKVLVGGSLVARHQFLMSGCEDPYFKNKHKH